MKNLRKKERNLREVYSTNVLTLLKMEDTCICNSKTKFRFNFAYKCRAEEKLYGI